MLRYLPFLLVLAVWIYAFIDVLNTPEKEVRHFPKVVWVILVLLFGEVLLGPIAWFVTGKKRRAPGAGAAGRGRTQWVAPDDNPEFLKSLRDERPDKGDDDNDGDGGKKRDRGSES
ncbi:PLDc N-terminal domain-containing protein [Streptomyces sp. NPDC087300]|uniref:PLDc N-terminal domain-containing protein n=1 Tax=Streptomyces sp. NPDC087300 TaxID=3365780 RepID=UPI0038047933